MFNIHTCVLKICGSKKVYIKGSSPTSDRIYEGKYLVEQFRQSKGLSVTFERRNSTQSQEEDIQQELQNTDKINEKMNEIKSYK